MTSTSSSADVVVVGGGTVGAWTAVLLAESGVKQVILLEAATLGEGASSRAAGMVRAQGGTEAAIRLGLRSQDFYRSSGDRFPLDCGFKAQGYLMPCFSEPEVEQAHARIALQQSLGLDVEWLSGSDLDGRDTGLAPGSTMGASNAPGDGYIDAPRNVLAYTAALTAQGVEVRERTAFTGLRTAGGRVVGVDTTAGPIDTDRVVLTGGPQLAEVGAAAGGRIPAGGARHQVVVTAPVASANVYELPMVFDLVSGIYWRPGESGGLLWGMSNPAEQPGVAGEFDWLYYQKARDRIEELYPAVRGSGSAPHVGRHHRLHARSPADSGTTAHRRRARCGQRGGLCRGPRHDVGPCGGAGGRRPHHGRRMRLAGPHRPRSGSLRRRRPQSA